MPIRPSVAKLLQAFKNKLITLEKLDGNPLKYFYQDSILTAEEQEQLSKDKKLMPDEKEALIDIFLEALRINPLINGVDFCNFQLTDAHAKAFAAAKNLRRLALSNNCITDVGARALAASDLEELDLSGNRITPRAVIPFLDNTSLVVLIIGCDMPGDLAKTLRAHVAANKVVLKLKQRVMNYEYGDRQLVIQGGALRIRDYPLSVDDLKRIVAALPLHPYITCLSLSECALDDDHADVLATAVGADSIVSLELLDNKITAKGVAALASHPSISRLDLSWNLFTFNEASPLFQNTKLTDLRFSERVIVRKSNVANGFKALAANQTLTSLEVISLSAHDYKRLSDDDRRRYQSEYDGFFIETRRRAQVFIEACGREEQLTTIQQLLDAAQVSPYAQAIYPTFDAEKPCTALHVAVLANQHQIARYLVKNFPVLLRIPAGNGETAVELAVRLGYTAMLAFLKSPNDLLGQCHFLLKCKIPQLYKPADPLAAFILLETCFNEQVELADLTEFNFNELSKFIDGQNKSPSANLLIAMILASPLGFFYDLKHPANDGTVSEVEYRANRLIDAARYAFKAMATSDIRMVHLALAFLSNLKWELKACLESDAALDDGVIERIDELLKRLERTTFDFMKLDKREVPLPPIDVVIRQPRASLFFALPTEIVKTEAKHAGVRFLM